MNSEAWPVSDRQTTGVNGMKAANKSAHLPGDDDFPLRSGQGDDAARVLLDHPLLRHAGDSPAVGAIGSEVARPGGAMCSRQPSQDHVPPVHVPHGVSIGLLAADGNAESAACG